MQVHLLANQQTQQQLRQLLKQSKQYIQDKSLRNQIEQLRRCSQNKIYHALNNDVNQYLQVMWQYSANMCPEISQVVPDLLGMRSNNVCDAILQNRIKINEHAHLSPFNQIREQQHNLKDKLSQINNMIMNDHEHHHEHEHHNQGNKQIKQMNDIYQALYSKQKIKQSEQFVKQKRMEQLERRKHYQQRQQKQKLEELKRQEEQQQRQRIALQEKKLLLRKKQEESKAKRQRQQMLRQQRKSQYLERKKLLDNKVPLFQKMEKQYYKWFDSLQNENMSRMHNQRKYYLERFDANSLGKHQKEYEQFRGKRQKQRSQRYQQMHQQQKKRSNKFNSSYELKKVPDAQEIQKQKAKEKLQKIKQYRAIVRENYQPRVDEKKRVQLLNLMNHLEYKHKKVRKIVSEDGVVSYQIIKPVGNKIIGVGYLESVKQMVEKSKRSPKKQDLSMTSPKTDTLNEKKKPIDYLAQLRNNRSRKIKSRAHSDFSTFVSRPDITYDDKVKKVLQESQKLEQSNKQNYMKLKHGNFKSSQQILACTQQIDQGYLKMVNMKLQLLENQNKKMLQNENNNGQEDYYQYY